MTMEMQKAISRLRLLLAAIKGKEDELENLSRQFQKQLDRAPNHTVQGHNSLEATLSIMEEIQERLDDAEQAPKHLAAIKTRAQEELRALELTDKVEQAKAEMASLKEDQHSDEPGDKAKQQRIEELERFIQEASIRAGRAITGTLEEGEGS